MGKFEHITEIVTARKTAEKEIMAVLKKLEDTTGCYVENVQAMEWFKPPPDSTKYMRYISAVNIDLALP